MVFTELGSVRIREQQKASTLAALRQAAQRCFVARGYQGSTVADIAREAGVATGTFYVHFDSKEALVESLREDFNRALAERLAPILAAAAGRPPAEVVGEAARAFLDHWHEERAFVAAYVQRSGAGVSPEALRDGINPPAFDLLRQLIEQRLGVGSDPVRVSLIAHGLLAIWLRIGLQYLFNEAVSRDAAVDVLVAMTLGAFASSLGEPPS
jgi:AcrR family transcriptional regulator